MRNPSDNLRAVIGSLEEYTSASVRRLADALAVEISQATPKATTHAASNWVWSSRPETAPYGSRIAVTWAAYHAGLAKLKSWTIRQGPLYMSNMVKYIGRLDMGWSPKAPPGYVGATLREVLARFGGSS